MTIDTQAPRTINTQMTQQEVNTLNYKVDAFNTKLKADQKIVSKNSLDEADFMTLLITQLKSQDPTKPLDDKEFIGQMAQFTSLKQMNQLTDGFKNMAKEFSFSKAVGLVNKTVSWTDENSESHSGVVNSIKVKNGDSYLNIEGMEVSLSQIDEVKNPEVVPPLTVQETVKASAAADAAVKTLLPDNLDEFHFVK